MLIKLLIIALCLIITNPMALGQAFRDQEDEESLILDIGSRLAPPKTQNQIKLWLTINAQRRYLEVSWKNAPVNNDHIFITNQEPFKFEKVRMVSGTPLAIEEGSGHSEEDRNYTNVNGRPAVIIPEDGYTTTTTTEIPALDSLDIENEGSGNGAGSTVHIVDTHRKAQPPNDYWIANGGRTSIVAALKPVNSEEWYTTGVPFDYELSRNVTIHTGCYGFWASYVNANGKILATACMRAYPRWMNEMRSVVGGSRIRDLFLVGSHDSGSYRPNFDPVTMRESLVTKYSLCQDDDIRGQLMHGVRYLDIRVGYYKNTDERFFINHGITKQRPLQEVINQVRDFIHETNEIVIFGLKEFPVGFGRNLGVHRLLVEYLRTQFNDLLVHPSLTWSASLRDIWQSRQNVILAYDKSSVVYEYPQLLFSSVEQRWGNKQTWRGLERHLRTINNFDVSRLSSRPVADMSELTPETFDVILDKLGGLRKMADAVNWRISQLYRDELGANANIVAADFVRGTTLMETSMEINQRKVIN